MRAADHRHMARALNLARRGLYSTDPNPRVGCVVVRDGQVVGEGFHECAGEAHAEIAALDMAGSRARGATAYITLEPCCHHGRTPPCTEAMLEAGIGRAVVAMEDPDPRMRGQGLRRLREAGLEVVCGVMEEQARGLNPGFVSRMSRGRPWVRLKLAVSLDGRTALANGQSRWISSKASRADVQRWRARSSAVMTGLGTVQADDPSLNVRLTAAQLGQAGPLRQPRRVILDTRLRMPVGARLLDLPGETIILTGDPDPGRRSELERRGARVVPLATHDDHLDLQAVMTRLGDLEFNEVQVECGQRLAGSLLEAGLVDELLVYMAPHLLGSRAMGMAMLKDFDDMRERLELSFREVTFVGPDLRILAVPRQVG